VSIFRRSLFLPALALAGCGQQPTADSTTAPPVVVVTPPSAVAAATPTPKPQSQAEPQLPAPAPPTFDFPPDLTGKALARVLAPDTSRPLPQERAIPAPKPRAVPATILEPNTLTQVRYVPPSLPLAKLPAAKPTNPTEKVPLDLGMGAEALPTKPVLPVVAMDTPRAPDVNLPPTPPVLGRPVVDRVSVDDPTNESGNAAIVAESVKVPLTPSGFLKVVVPDPFELGAQVKPNVPATAEPRVMPVPVIPQRVK